MNHIDIVLNSDKEQLVLELQELNNGMLNSFILQMKMGMQGLIYYKDNLLKSDKTKEELEDTLKNVYRTLQKYEDVILVAQEVQNQRRIDTKSFDSMTT